MSEGAYRTTDTCARCGAAIDTTRAAFSADGQICVACETRENQVDVYHSTDFWGFGPLGWSLVAFACNPCLIFSILGIVGGFKELQTIRALGADAGPTGQNARTKAIAAIVLGFVHPVLLVGIVGFGLLGNALAPEPRYDSYDYEHDPYYDDSTYDDPAGEQPVPTIEELMRRVDEQRDREQSPGAEPIPVPPEAPADPELQRLQRTE